MITQHKVVIAATVAAVLGRRARITRVVEVTGGTWARQGRAVIQTSHDLSAPLVRMVHDWGTGKK